MPMPPAHRCRGFWSTPPAPDGAGRISGHRAQISGGTSQDVPPFCHCSTAAVLGWSLSDVDVNARQIREPLLCACLAPKPDVTPDQVRGKSGKPCQPASRPASTHRSKPATPHSVPQENPPNPPSCAASPQSQTPCSETEENDRKSAIGHGGYSKHHRSVEAIDLCERVPRCISAPTGLGGVLHATSGTDVCAVVSTGAWCPVRESNPRPSLYKSAALASELTGQTRPADVATAPCQCKMPQRELRRSGRWKRPSRSITAPKRSPHPLYAP